MKLVVVGLGQCGGRIADEFVRLNIKARVQRGIDIVTAAFAVNTDVADLSGLTRIKRDYQHRILIGGRRTGGHGVGKINELGAEVAKEDGDKVIDTIRTNRRFSETDAFLLVAGAAGGTGSGSIAVMTQHIKERYIDKPVYNLLVLPFEHEEQTEERTVYNAATCLKSAYLVADATLLVDNQRYVKKESPIAKNLSFINSLIVEPFYNLLCAGEETKPKHIGAKILDAGDIIQTLSGWTAIGYGEAHIPLFKFFSRSTLDFRNKASRTQKGIQAMNEAISGLSLKCTPQDAKRVLYLISGPAKEIGVDLIKEVGGYLKNLAPQAVIRSGDYPRGGGSLEITVVMSEFSDVAKVSSYFAKALKLISANRKRQQTAESAYETVEATLRDIPSLL